MFDQVLVEKDLASHPQVEKILARFKNVPMLWIDRYDEYWGKFKKPYLHKRTNLNLFLANKRGQLVKKTPDAYGIGRGEHYYFIHAYNCIYECQYCYLQGHFKTPDIVLFLNHDDILQEMESITQYERSEVWFHAGEYSDSLALSHLSGELPVYFDFFKKHPNAYLELRSKSANIREILKLNPLPNVIVSFSLSPEEVAQSIDLNTPDVRTRLKAMVQLKNAGFKLAIHFDPIINRPMVLKDYEKLIHELKENGLLEIEYLSLGVVRFTESVYKDVEFNYPDSIIHADKMIKSFDQKIRYPRPLRMKLLTEIKDQLMKAGLSEEKIYLCME